MTEMSSGSPRRAALTDALLKIVADRGLDQVSVREVAAAAGVSIGTVQHYFPTKDDMLAEAFSAVVARIRARIYAVPLGTDVRRNLSNILRELLPIDAPRAAEVRIQIAFAARAATTPALAEIQREVLAELHAGVTEGFVAAGMTAARARIAAHLAIAGADGLALHAVSSGPWLSGRARNAALDLLLDAIVPAQAGPGRDE